VDRPIRWYAWRAGAILSATPFLRGCDANTDEGRIDRADRSRRAASRLAEDHVPSLPAAGRGRPSRPSRPKPPRHVFAVIQILVPMRSMGTRHLAVGRDEREAATLIHELGADSRRRSDESTTRMAATPHGGDERAPPPADRDGAPIGRRRDQQPLGPVNFDHIDGSLGRHLFVVG